MLFSVWKTYRQEKILKINVLCIDYLYLINMLRRDFQGYT